MSHFLVFSSLRPDAVVARHPERNKKTKDGAGVNKDGGGEGGGGLRQITAMDSSSGGGGGGIQLLFFLQDLTKQNICLSPESLLVT